MLKETVEAMLKRHTETDEDYRVFAREVADHGCASGVLPEMILTCDTVGFYESHKHEINALLAELESQPADILSGWDREDRLALGDWNRTLLSWFAVEYTAGQIAEESPGE